jgi:NADPH:quinone reductase-like Zn-dependent oxidoreductase
MKNRKAVIYEFGEPSVIQIIEENLPEPKSGEATIRIEASTVLRPIFLFVKESIPF